MRPKRYMQYSRKKLTKIIVKLAFPRLGKLTDEEERIVSDVSKESYD